MRSILRSAILAAATFSISAFADDPTDGYTDGQDPNNISGGLVVRTATDLGCYSSPGKMFDMGPYTYQAVGWCHPLCLRLAKGYFAFVNGTNCYCGDAPPDKAYKVESSNCNTNCTGFDAAYCGGTNFWDVQNANIRNGDPTGSQSITIPPQTYTWAPSGAATSSSSSTGPATVVVTQSSTSTATAQPSSGGPNTAALAAGIVVAIVVLAAIGGAVIFFMRRRRQQALVEEQRRHEMMTNFVTAEKPGSSYTSPDARLDPSLMFQRRLSDGSIRDNEDYSRRILKVANPDA